MCVHEGNEDHVGVSIVTFLRVSDDRNVDSVDDLMSDIMEQQELAQEITDVISNPISFGDQVDEV